MGQSDTTTLIVYIITAILLVASLSISAAKPRYPIVRADPCNVADAGELHLNQGAGRKAQTTGETFALHTLPSPSPTRVLYEGSPKEDDAVTVKAYDIKPAKMLYMQTTSTSPYPPRSYVYQIMSPAAQPGNYVVYYYAPPYGKYCRIPYRDDVEPTSIRAVEIVPWVKST